jgi:ubiquitin thioesterase OTU1
LRIRSPEGKIQPLDDVDADLALEDFLVLIFSLTGVEPERIRLKAGYPLKYLNLSQAKTVADLGLANGDSIIVENGPPGVAAAGDVSGPLFSLPVAKPVPVAPQPQLQPAVTQMRALPQSVPVARAASPPAQSVPSRKVPKTVIGAHAGEKRYQQYEHLHLLCFRRADVASFRPVSLTDDSGTLVRRVVPADNSCLFNSVGYTLHGHSRTRAREIRVCSRWSPDLCLVSDWSITCRN